MNKYSDLHINIDDAVKSKIYMNAALSTIGLINEDVLLLEVFIDMPNELLEWHFSLVEIDKKNLSILQDIMDNYIDLSTDLSLGENFPEFDFRCMVSIGGGSLSKDEKLYLTIYQKCNQQYFEERNIDDYLDDYLMDKIVFL
ncbi:hypothetical protein [Neisseria dentiae]|uniref:hypothetical protein n=1 Tax=Neisseria dentiae TaxID=194197 RepID=UPI0035A0BA58